MASITKGSGIPDGLRIGSIRGINVSDMNYPTFDNGAPGIPTMPSYSYVIKPLNLNNESLFEGAAIAEAGLVTLAAGVGVTVDTTTFPDYTAYKLDVCRSVYFNGTGTENVINFTVSGWDMYGAQVVERITLPIGDRSVETSKAFLWVHTIQASAPTGDGTVSIGVSNNFGFPYAINNTSDIMIFWNGLWDYAWNADDGFLESYGILSLADNTYPATNISSDVRGTYTLNIDVLAPDGNHPLVFKISNPNMSPYYNITNNIIPENKAVYGVPQYAGGWL